MEFWEWDRRAKPGEEDFDQVDRDEKYP